MPKQKRVLTVVLEPLTGTINRVYVFVNGTKVIDADGTSPQQWTGKVPEEEIRIKFRVTGIDAAQYNVKINLSGNIQNQATITLDGGYHEWEIRI